MISNGCLSWPGSGTETDARFHVDIQSWTNKTTPPSVSVTEKMAPYVFSANSSVIQGEGWFCFLQAKIVRQ